MSLGAYAFDQYLLQVNNTSDFSSLLINQFIDAAVTNSSFTPISALASNTM
ncbi:MAG: hypothetical protein ABSA01_13195 [Anaerolineales bacterium]